MKVRDYQKIISKLLNIIEEGVHVVDAQGNSIIYNDAMAKLEKMTRHDVLKRPFTDVFESIDDESSTILQALRYKKSTQNHHQIYLNKYGKEISTINTTIPVLNEGSVIGAIEVARNITEIKEMSHKILELHQETRQEHKGNESKIKRYNFDSLIGKNRDFLETISLARKAAQNDMTVLIYGETGTGKELLAQSIHYEGPRKNKPFLAQNCAALPGSLLEGLLFGTAKGGFTGAVDRAGLFEQADGGTLLLDEVSAMPYELQGKLLRVLQEDYIRRVGGEKDIPIDVRTIATINEPAKDLISKGCLRKDLYYRLNIINISLNPLRERKDDIPHLTECFLEKHTRAESEEPWSISDKAKKLLLDYDYPGNVRELENLIIRGINAADGSHRLTDEHIMDQRMLDRRIKTEQMNDPDCPDDGLVCHLENIEKRILETVLQNNFHNITRAADQLQIKRQTLQHKMKKYGLV